MFEMNEDEFENWRTQFASSKSDQILKKMKLIG